MAISLRTNMKKFFLYTFFVLTLLAAGFTYILYIEGVFEKNPPPSEMKPFEMKCEAGKCAAGKCGGK